MDRSVLYPLLDLLTHPENFAVIGKRRLGSFALREFAVPVNTDILNCEMAIIVVNGVPTKQRNDREGTIV